MSASRHWSREIQLSNFWDSLSEPVRQPISSGDELEQLVLNLQLANAAEIPDQSFRYQLRERFVAADPVANQRDLIQETPQSWKTKRLHRNPRWSLVAAVVAGLLLAAGWVAQELDLTSRFESDRSTIPAVVPEGLISPAMYLGGPGRTGDIAAVGPDNSPQVAWTYESGASIQAAPIAVDGTVYVGNTDGTFMAIDLDSGDEVWSVQTGGSIRVAAAINGNVVYVASGSYGGGGWLIAFDRFTGNELWRQELQDGIWSSPAILAGAMYLATLDGTIYSIDLMTGIANWTFKASSSVIDPVAVSDQVLAATSVDGVLTVLDPYSGNQLWSWRVPDEERNLAAPSVQTVWMSPLIVDGRVIVNYLSSGVAAQRTVRSFDAGSGQAQWSYQYFNATVVYQGNQYVAVTTMWTYADQSRTWYGLSLVDGSEVAQVKLQEITGLPQISVWTESAIYTTSTGLPYYYIHDPDSGKLRWKVSALPEGQTGYGPTSDQQPIGSEPMPVDGMLVIGMRTGEMLAIADRPTEPDDG